MRNETSISAFMSMSVLVGMLAAGNASAVTIESGSLGLTGGNPDIQSNFLNFDFNATSGLFNIQSAFGGGEYTFNGVSENIIDSTFQITGSASGGSADLSLTITGALASLGGGDQVLLDGELTAFSNSGSGVFEFIFGNISGALSSMFGPQVGVIYADAGLASGFDFSQDASTVYTGNADAFAVPVPISGSSSLILLCASLLGMFVSRKARNNGSSFKAI